MSDEELAVSDRPKAPPDPEEGDPEPGERDPEIALLPPREQAEVEAADKIHEAEETGATPPEMDSLALATFNLARAQEWSARADLYRKTPKEHKGVQVSGFVKRFEHPFSIADTESWARKHRGGGTYEMKLYDGKGVLRRRHTFECEGRVILPDEVPEEGEIEAKKQIEAPASEQTWMRERLDLERQLLREQADKQRMADRSEFDRRFSTLENSLARLTDAITQQQQQAAAAAAPKGSSANDLVAALSESPVMVALVEKFGREPPPPPKDETTKLIFEQMSKSFERGMKEMSEAMKAATAQKPEGMTELVKGVKQLKELAGGDNAEAKAFSRIIDTALPKLIDATTKIQLHKAGVGEGKDEEFGAKYVVDRLTDLGSSILQRRQQAAEGQVAPAASGFPAGTALPGPSAMGQPTPSGVAGATALDGGEEGVIFPTPEKPGQAEGAAPAAAPATEQRPPIDPAVFESALKYLEAGKGGRDLANDIMEANGDTEAGESWRYIAPKAIRYLESSGPEKVLAEVNPQLPRPDCDPLLDAIGQEFMREFCRFFSDEPEEEEGTMEEEATS